MSWLLKEKNRILSLVVLFLFCLSLIPSTTFSYKKKEEILFISSYNGSLPSWSSQLSGIQDVLKNDYILDVEVMDTKRFYDDEYLEILDELFRYKYLKRRKPDAIIVSDDFAYDYVLEHYEELFKDSLVIFIGVNSLENAMKADSYPNMTGFVESLSIKETVDVAIKLTPGIRRLVVISDQTESGQEHMASFNKIRPAYEKKLEVLSVSMADYSFPELESLLRTFDKHDALVLFAANADKNNERINFNDVLDIVNNNAQTPVYHLWQEGVGEGLAGGMVVSHYDYGVQAANLLKRVLNNKVKIEDVKVVRESKNYYVFDDQIIEKYNIERGLIPVEASIINRFETTEEARARYSSVTTPYLIALGFLFLLITGLLFNIKEKNKYAAQLKEMAFFDKLTGLSNRLSLQNELTAQIEQGKFGALIILDIDNFKNINDIYGHSIGDEVVKEVGRLFLKILETRTFFLKQTVMNLLFSIWLLLIKKQLENI